MLRSSKAGHCRPLKFILKSVCFQKELFSRNSRKCDGFLQKQPPKVFLELSQNSQEKQLCQCLFFNKVAGLACNFIKKETLAQVFSCEFWEISKNNFLHRKNLWNIWWSRFLQLNFIKDFKSSFNSLLWNTIWNNWIIYYVSQARIAF